MLTCLRAKSIKTRIETSETHVNCEGTGLSLRAKSIKTRIETFRFQFLNEKVAPFKSKIHQNKD